MSTRWIEGAGDDVIVVDDTYFPIIVSTWIGAPSEKAVRAYYVWLGDVLLRARREGAPLVNVTDSGKAGVPSGDVRRLIADLALQWGREGADAHPVTSYVVVDSAIMRGVMNALSWLHGSMKTTQFATCQQALESAVQVLARATRPPPPGLDPARWRRPGRSPRSA